MQYVFVAEKEWLDLWIVFALLLSFPASFALSNNWNWEIPAFHVYLLGLHRYLLISEKFKYLLSLYLVGGTLFGTRGNFCLLNSPDALKNAFKKQCPYCLPSTLDAVESKIGYKLFNQITLILGREAGIELINFKWFLKKPRQKFHDFFCQVFWHFLNQKKLSKKQKYFKACIM